MTERWDNDTEFEDSTVSSVKRTEGGWEIGKESGMFFFLSAEEYPDANPREGMPIRLYGNIRGVFLGGRCIFYRTKEEDHERYERQAYGVDATEWLQRWDAGKSVWSVSMGGLGPQYEQAIQITAAEMLRWLLREKPENLDADAWPEVRDRLDKGVGPVTEPLGLSGAQWGAALNLSTALYLRGPIQVMHEIPQARKIQVSREMPSLSGAA